MYIKYLTQVNKVYHIDRLIDKKKYFATWHNFLFIILFKFLIS